MRVNRSIAGSLVSVLLLGTLFILPATSASAAVAPGNVTTIAGGTAGSGSATNFGLRPAGLAVVGSQLFAVDTANRVVRRVDLVTGLVETHAGNGRRNYGLSSSSETALKWGLEPVGPLTADSAGNLFFSSGQGAVKVAPNGAVTSIAGQNPGPVTSPELAGHYTFAHAFGVAADGSGNVFVSEWSRNRIRRIDAAGRITDVLRRGDWTPLPDGGNGGPASQAEVAGPDAMLSHQGSLYIAETGAHRIRRIDSSGVITTFAGNGTAGSTGDGGPATSAQLNYPSGIAADAGGNIFIASKHGHNVRKVSREGVISRVAGDGVAGFSGDGGPAHEARLFEPTGLAADAGGNVYVSDSRNLKIRRIGPSGIIETLAGNGNLKTGGDGGPAVKAQVAALDGGTFDRQGNYLFLDSGRIRRIDTAGVITTVAGIPDAPETPRFGPTGDGGPAIEALLPGGVNSIAVDSKGNIFVPSNARTEIRKIDAQTGIIDVWAGCQRFESCSPGRTPIQNMDMTIDAEDNLVVTGGFADRRILKIDPSGSTSVLAGTGAHKGTGGYPMSAEEKADLGDGGPALDANLYGPGTLAVGAGNIYFNDGRTPHLLRKVDSSGTLSTISGLGSLVLLYPGISQGGFGIPASEAHINVLDLAAGPTGSLWFAGGLNSNTIGRIGPDGVLFGGGYQSPFPVKYPTGLKFDSSGDLWVTSNEDHPGIPFSTGTGFASIKKISQPERLVPEFPPVAGTGWNALGQLGDGTTVDRAGVKAVSGLTGSTRVAAGYYHSLALAPDGGVNAWGWNALGQLGDGSLLDRTAPVKVNGLTNVVDVSAGAYFSVALKSDGTVWAWGDNTYAELGDGTRTIRRVPVRVAGLPPIRSISAGTLHTLVVGRDGSLWGWGYNGFGQLGDRTRTDRLRPVRIYSAGVVQASAGGLHSLATLADGSASGWGWNGLGQVGDNTTVDRLSPVPVKQLPAGPVKQVSAGYAHSLLLTDDGKGFGWGWNPLGQAGTPGNPMVPGPLSGPLPPLRELSAGLVHSVAVTSDGRAFGWGYGTLGALGAGQEKDSVPQPTWIQNTYGVSQAAAGAFHTVIGAIPPKV